MLLLALIIVAVAAAQNQHGSQPYSKSETASNPKGNYPAVASSQNKTDDPIARYTLWLMIFTGGLFVSTIGLWIATAFIWESSERQIGVVKESADAAKTAAEAAKASADLLPKIERAYVFVRIKHGSVRGVQYRICNYGKTPAILKKIDTNLKILSEPPENLTNDPVWRGYVLIPSEEWNPELGDAIIADVTKELLIAQRERRAHLWFYGSVIYDDVMGIEHVTRFRFRYMPDLKRFDADGAEQYNCRT